MQLYINIITYYAIILIKYIMDLDTYENLIHKRVKGQQNIMNLKKKNTDFQNQKIDRDFHKRGII